jgi:hypothetical protein
LRDLHSIVVERIVWLFLIRDRGQELLDSLGVLEGAVHQLLLNVRGKFSERRQIEKFVSYTNTSEQGNLGLWQDPHKRVEVEDG